MCFGIEMSILFAISGLSSSYFLKRRGLAFSFYFPIAYFSIMEIFQSIQYYSISHNLHKLNVFVTMLSYIHICFQPLFFNMFQAGYKNDSDKTYIQIVYPLCILGGLGMLLRLKHFSSLYDHLYEYFLNMHTIDTCSCTNYVDYFESNRTLAFIGAENHVGWEINLFKPIYLTYGLNLHGFLTFYLPIAVEKRITLPTLIYFVGMIFSSFLSNNLHVQPAIWCLIHIPISILGIRFYLWQKHKQELEEFRRFKEN